VLRKSTVLPEMNGVFISNTSPDQKLFCGDGGDAGQVAKAKDGMWIYLFTPDGDKFTSTRLVNMKNHNYKTEPKCSFQPGWKVGYFQGNV
jgi:oligogalacturonide lyase